MRYAKPARPTSPTGINNAGIGSASSIAPLADEAENASSLTRLLISFRRFANDFCCARNFLSFSLDLNGILRFALVTPWF